MSGCLLENTENTGKPDLEKIKTASKETSTLQELAAKTSRHYFLAPDGLFLSKCNKAELQPLLKTRSIPSDSIEVKTDSSVLLIDFMAEARKNHEGKRTTSKRLGT